MMMRKTNGSLSSRVFATRLRAVVGDTPKAFAFEVGISLSALYNYLRGRIPSTAVLYRIATHTGRPMEWFLGDDPSHEDEEVVPWQWQGTRNHRFSPWKKGKENLVKVVEEERL